MRRRSLAFCAVLVACVGCDQATKEIARTALEASAALSLAGDTVRLELTANPGAFLSMGADLPSWIRDLAFLVVAPVGLLILCAVYLRSGSLRSHQLVGVALLAGGGLGNWLDRMFQSGSVTDFVSIGLGPLRTGIFNVADVAVLVGVALLARWGREDPPPTHGPSGAPP